MPNTAKPRYVEIAEQLSELITSGSLRPGDALPSIRTASTRHRVSKGTIVQAYGLLETLGLIEARPQSGYYVKMRQVNPAKTPRMGFALPKFVEIDTSQRLQAILGGQIASEVVSLGSSFPSSSLFPIQSLNRALCASMRYNTQVDSLQDLQLGLPELRRLISQRYLELGYSVPAEEILITCGGMEAISLSLQSVTTPNDVVVIDSPTFYSGMQLLHQLRLRPIEIPADANEGMSLALLDSILRQHDVKACLLMTNCQNPLGFTMEEAKKQELVALLAKHNVPLVENDVYAELQFGLHHHRAAKAFDKSGLVLHCGSFTKSLAPGFKIGWVASGRFREQVLNRKFATTLGTSIPPQKAIAHFLTHHAYDRHLRKLRQTLFEQASQMSDAVANYFPKSTLFTRPRGGYVLWLQLPEKVDAIELFEMASSKEIGIAPGPIFSATKGYQNFIRLNYGYPWSPSLDRAMKWLGQVAQSMC
jgi:DNA-binding transcriptional MocR family regulator